VDPVSDDALHREVEFDLLSAAFQLDPPATFDALCSISSRRCVRTVRRRP
jgi:hypothetical protein